MQLKNFSVSNGKYYLLILLIGVLAFWPLTFHIFSLKNDALSYFLPYRYHISQSIRHGYFPFWSPYLYTGLPIHSDIQSGVWNPIVLVISLFTTYDMNVLQAESLFYLVTAGICFFKLCAEFGFDKTICLTLAVSYMCSGFMIDCTSFIPWITSAAWMPLLLLYLMRMVRQPDLAHSIKLALSISLVFLSGYSSYFIFAAYLTAFTALIFTIQLFRTSRQQAAWKFIKYMSVTLVITLVICSPALISYIEFFPFYRRGNGIGEDRAQVNPFALQNLISYLFPAASYKLETSNDISSRNAFIGIIPLLFIIYSFRFRLTSLQKIILLLTVICFLFSLGNITPVRSLFYHLLPLMNTFRHPATARLFTGIGLLLLAGYGWNLYKNTPHPVYLKKYSYGLLIISVGTLLSCIVFSGAVTEILKWNGSFFSKTSVREILQTSTFPAWLLITAIIQIPFIWLSVSGKNNRLVIVNIANMMVMTFLCMPFTMVSQYSPAEVNRFIHSFPEGFPLELARQPVTDKTGDTSTLSAFGYTEFYSKRISLQEHMISPTINTDYAGMMENTSLRQKLSSSEFAYVDSGDRIRIETFSPNGFKLTSRDHLPRTLHITQQFNPNWKAVANDTVIPIRKDAVTFMKAEIPAGQVSVRFEYRPGKVIIAGMISILYLAGCIASLIYFRATKQ